MGFGAILAYHITDLTSSHLISTDVISSELWSESVRRGCDQSERAYCMATCLRHVTRVVSGFTSVGYLRWLRDLLHSGQVEWIRFRSNQFRRNEISWDEVRWDEICDI